MKKLSLVIVVIFIVAGGIYFTFRNKDGGEISSSPFYKAEERLLPRESISSIKLDGIRFVYEAFYNPEKMSFEDFTSRVLTSPSFDTIILGESHSDISEIAMAERIIEVLAENRDIAKLFEESSNFEQGEPGILTQYSGVLETLRIPSEKIGPGEISSTPFWPILKEKIRAGEFYAVYVGKAHASHAVKELVDKYPGMLEGYPVDDPDKRPILDVAFERAGRKPLTILLFGVNRALRSADYAMSDILDNPEGILNSIQAAGARGEFSSMAEVVSLLSPLIPEVSTFVKTNADKFIEEWETGLGLNSSIADSFFVPLGDNTYAAIISRDMTIQSELDPAWTIPYSTIFRREIFNDPQYGGLLSKGDAVLGGPVSHGQRSITETQGIHYYNVNEQTQGYLWLNFHTGELTLQPQGNY